MRSLAIAITTCLVCTTGSSCAGVTPFSATGDQHDPAACDATSCNGTGVGGHGSIRLGLVVATVAVTVSAITAKVVGHARD